MKTNSKDRSAYPTASASSLRARGRGPNAWALSFGDLLTLLLCFFLTIVSMSPLNPAVRKANQALSAQKDEKNVPPSKVQPQNSELGPRIAKHVSAEQEKGVSDKGPLQAEKLEVMDFLAEDFEGESGILSDQAANRLKMLMNQQDSQLISVEIETCVQGARETEAISWFEATRQALALKGQFIDAVKPSPEMRMRVLGADCETATNLGPSSARVALGFKTEVKQSIKS